MSTQQWETSFNGQDWDVCGEGGGDMIADLAKCDNAEHNARLIAAAPDLLAALKDLARQEDWHGEVVPPESPIGRAYAAIAKAEGRDHA